MIDDDDPALHASLRAQTRLAEPSIEMVCLHRIDGVLAVETEHGRRSIDLDKSPAFEMVNALVRQSIGVSTRGLVRALLDEPPPAAWREQALLRHRRPVIFENGSAQVAGHTLTLDPELGLVIERNDRKDLP